MEDGGAFGSAKIDPGGPVVAGDRGTWRVVYTVGERGMAPGGAIRIRPPQRGMVRWQVGLVTAEASRPGTTCRVELTNCHPISTHWRQAPIVQVDVLGERLEPGDTVSVTLGERGGYSRGYYIRAQAPEHAHRGAIWDIWADVEGNKSAPPESAVNDPWVQLEAAYTDIIGGPAARLSVAARQVLPVADRTRVVVAARDRFGNHSEAYDGQISVIGAEEDLSETVRGGKAELAAPLAQDRVTRYTAFDAASEIIGTSNAVAPGFGDIAGHAVYFGDLHVMTGEGIIAGALEGTEYAYRWGRDIAGLDFCVATNNLSCWDRDMPLDDLYNSPGEFVTIPAYEVGFKIGHKNV